MGTILVKGNEDSGNEIGSRLAGVSFECFCFGGEAVRATGEAAMD